MGEPRRQAAACLVCFRLRRRCEFDAGARRCRRCEEAGTICTPRVSLRGRRPAQGTPAILGGELPTPGTAAAEGADLLPILQPCDLAEHLRSAAAWARAVREMGHPSAPEFVRQFCKLMLLQGRLAGSSSRLHAATTLAISCGVKLDVSSVCDELDPPPLAAEVKLWEFVRDFYLGDAPAFVTTIAQFQRQMVANEQWSELLSHHVRLERVCIEEKDSALTEFLRHIADPKTAQAVLAQALRKLTQAEQHTTFRDYVFGEFVATESVLLRNAEGLVYRAVPHIAIFIGFDGRSFFGVYRFENPVPESPEAARALLGVRARCARSAPPDQLDAFLLHVFPPSSDADSFSVDASPLPA